VATVLFADLVGFTSLAERRDPEQVKNLVDSCFERLVRDINQFGGKVDKIIGDAILALFGAPVAHEDDAERAVRAALRMQQTVAAYRDATDAEVQLRIGVNTGEVLVGSLRAGGDYTAMGDAVNIAQRLQASARPGSVIVGSSTHAATRLVIDYRSIGSVSVKGRDEPIDTWEALSTLLPPGYRPRRIVAPLVGRDAELGILAHAVEAASTRRRAHLVLLFGEAGVGKSRLAEEVAERARQKERAAVFEGRCVPYGEANVWWPVAEALRQACGVAPDDPLHLATEACRQAISVAIDQPASSAEVTRTANGLLYLMGYEVPLREIDAQRAREEAVHSVLAFVEGSARSRPVVVVLSDLHWADDVVLELLDALLERLSRSPVIVVATARHELHDRWSVPAGRHNQVVVNLDPLDRAASADLLDALAEADLPADLRDALLDRSGGNPFYLEELVTLVATSDVAAAELLGDRGVAFDLPDTLRGLVAARIDGLSDHERATLEDAAVWGRSGPTVALERMCVEVHGSELGDVLDGLVDKEVLLVDGARWSFRSDLVREVAYNTLTKADRARRHHGIAAYLEKTVPDRHEASERTVDVVAYHYAAAAALVAELGAIDYIPPSVTESALDWLDEAARRAQVAHVLPVAERLVSQALELLGEPGGRRDDPTRRVKLLLARGRAASGLRALDEARCDIEMAGSLARELGDEHAVAQALLVRGDIEQKAGEFDRAVDTLGEAQRRFVELGDTQGMAEALRHRGMTEIFRGENRDAERCISAALDAYRSLGDRRGEAWALQNLAWISFTEGRATDAEERLTESASLFTELGDGGGLSWALGLLAFVRYQKGDFDEAERLGSQVLREAQDRGDRWGEGMMLVLIASVHLWSGRAEAAVGPLADALELFRSLNDLQGIAQASTAYGRSLISAGRVGEGFDVIDGVIEQFGQLDNDDLSFAVASVAASAATQVGDPARALRVLAPFDASGRGEVGVGVTERVVAEGLALLQRGSVDEALAVLMPAAADRDDGRSSFAGSALALALAAEGRRAEVEALEAEIGESQRASYLDRATTRLAVQLVRAREGDESAVEGFTDLVAQLDATDDRVGQAVMRLAESIALEWLGLPAASMARDAADLRLDQLGIEAEGWITLCRRVLSGDKAPAQHPVG
jgi:class 3 adenylate cyclase/tetratricopeptide (TPR) repeat protein